MLNLEKSMQTLIPTPPSRYLLIKAHPVNSVNNLAAIVSFSIFFGSVGFDAAQSQNRRKNILGEPALVSLAVKAPYDSLNFFAGDRLSQVNKKIGCPEVSIILDDFVFENQVVSEGVPSQLGNQPVVLMEISAIMRQDKIREIFSFEFLKEVLYFSSNIGKIAVSKFLDDDLLSLRVRQEQTCTLDCFRPSLPGCSQHDPVDLRSGVFFKQS